MVHWHSECIAIGVLTTTWHCNWPQFNWVKEVDNTASVQWSLTVCFGEVLTSQHVRSVLSWFVMVHVLSWFVMVRHGSCFVMVRGGLSWFVMVCGGSSWFVVVRGGLWWFVMVRHGSCFVMVRGGSSWFNTYLTTLSAGNSNVWSRAVKTWPLSSSVKRSILYDQAALNWRDWSCLQLPGWFTQRNNELNISSTMRWNDVLIEAGYQHCIISFYPKWPYGCASPITLTSLFSVNTGSKSISLHKEPWTMQSTEKNFSVYP